LVIVGGEGGRWTGGIQRQIGAMLLSPFVRQDLGFFVNKENAETLEAMNELVDAGQVSVIVDHTYPLVDAAKAVESLESGQAAGRLAVSV
jgi:NADPH:quinone reductase-like Zn-dependent oxidoreductase